MLFLCKRSWSGSIIVLAVLLGSALVLRRLLGTGPPVAISLGALAAGLAVCGGVILSDALVHQSLCLILGESYRRRFLELADVFRGQSTAAVVAGALLAGLGEEPLFRGISTDPAVLAGGAVVFGLLHHVRLSLWPFTLWSVYEGLLFAAALYLTGNLLVTVVAHFLHDLVGFFIFRRERRARESNPHLPGGEPP